MVLYRPDISVVTMPASMEGLTLIERRVKLDAVVLSLHEQGIVLWGWREDTLVVGSDTLFTYLKPR
jgi:hypothetical protein